ncbi:MAG: SDR family NAD(P)-dependent oxidoreductase [Clostridiales bacterium]|nr:SDR family NAD(P)-dependent oxidoreductase [Clostridiales bacterium]
MKDKIAIVSGGSSGIGLNIAENLVREGYTVYNLSRRNFIHSNILHIPCDVSDENVVRQAVHKVFDNHGCISLLVCCAGFGIAGAVEFTSLEDAKKQMDVNFFGTVNLIKAVVPFMRKNKYGKIACISSVAGAIPIPFQNFYSVSKAAINAYTFALINEIKEFNIQVTSILPGDIKTNFTGVRKTSLFGDDIYKGRIHRSISKMEKDEQSGMASEIAAKKIMRIINRKNWKPQYCVGFQYSFLTVLSRLLPIRLTAYVIKKMYAE